MKGAMVAECMCLQSMCMVALAVPKHASRKVWRPQINLRATETGCSLGKAT